jgi:hypothetical protein
MKKVDVLGILNELEADVQALREEGETDLRTVLHLIDVTIRQVRALEETE